MYRIVLSLISVLTLFISITTHAVDSESIDSQPSELQGYGAFSNLNKDWMLMALYGNGSTGDQEFTAQRLEIKITAKKFSSRRFRQLWLETLAVEHGTEKVALMQSDLQKFFNIVQGSLKQGDTLIIERTEVEGLPITDVKLNYHNLAQLSEGFLDTLVQSLVGKHPPTQALKAGLTGQQGLRAQTNLGIQFDRLEPTLPRIAEISRWGKRILASHP
ncbi:hypothetical protein A9R00_07205 [Oleispira antarctica]|uniref:Chalcone isomerase domain-containing protein n=1 Tax=Oleispira antarctica TaxID=188908 RepID=A0A1Y5HSA5_OLEAN|nr:hypothetical protein A9R00_07205 [Oleispira antarctica]